MNNKHTFKTIKTKPFQSNFSIITLYCNIIYVGYDKISLYKMWIFEIILKIHIFNISRNSLISQINYGNDILHLLNAKIMLFLSLNSYS